MSSTSEQRAGVGQFLWWGRRAVVAGLLIGSGLLLAIDGVPTVCRGAVAETTVVRVCEPMTITDPRVVLFLLLVLLLLFPELSELELAGVLTLKRRLDEAKAEVAEVKNEVAAIRTQAAAAASVQAGLSNQTTVVFGDRPMQVGEAVSELQRDGGEDGVAENVGSYAQLAFEAGMVGLIQLMPDWARNSLLLGYTVGETGTLELTYSAGSQSAELNAAVGDVSPRLSGVAIADLGPGWAVTAPAVEDTGAPVGAVALMVPREDFPPGGQTLLGPEIIDDLAAWTQMAANGYARLLIDILGETPRERLPQPAGETAAGGGQ